MSSQPQVPPPPPPPKLQFDEGIRYTTSIMNSIIGNSVGNNNDDDQNKSNNSSNDENDTTPLLMSLFENPRLQQPTTTITPISISTSRGNSSSNNNTTTTGTVDTTDVTSIYEYYEIERLVNEIHSIAKTIVIPTTTTTTTFNNINHHNTTVRIAIQLPDELLMDAMDLCHEYELAFEENHNTDNNNDNHVQYQVYILGDTTYAPCCPDRMAAQHISAHILIHYGHACFSSLNNNNHNNINIQSSVSLHDGENTHQPPPQLQPPPEYPIVLYSFGKQMISISQCVQDVRQALYSQLYNNNDHHHQDSTISTHSTLDKNTTLEPQPTLSIPNSTNNEKCHSISQNILLLYEVQYTHAMKDLRNALLLQPPPPPHPVANAQSTTANTNTNHHDHPTNTNNHSSIKCKLYIKMGRIPQWKDSSETSPTSLPQQQQQHNPTIDTVTSTTTNAPISTDCCRSDTTGSSSINVGRCDCISAVTISNHPPNDQVVDSMAPTPPHIESNTSNTKSDSMTTKSDSMATSTSNIIKIKEQYHHIMVGGLELPYPFSSKLDNDDGNDDDEWVCNSDCGMGSSSNMSQNENSYIILYIGDVTSRPFLNIVLRFLSSSNVTCIDRNNNNIPVPPQQYKLSSIWAWTPTKTSTHLDNNPSSYGQLCTNVLENSNVFHKILQRRYYLIQKAKQCTTFGIIVAHMTPNIQPLVQSIQQYLDQQQRCTSSGKNDSTNINSISYYTFVVGKINPTKLANFPEIECFILVACPEHALLQNERELYPIPIITPYELLVAFGSNNSNSNNNNHPIEWGNTPYSTDPNDYWTLSSAVADLSPTDPALQNDNNDSINDDDDDYDAPYFSLVTGKYETRTKSVATEATTMGNTVTVVASEQNGNVGNDVTILSTRTDGTIVQFGKNKSTSAAAEFLKQREYQGLVMMTPPPTNDSQLQEQVEQGDNHSSIQPAILGRTGIASNYSNR